MSAWVPWTKVQKAAVLTAWERPPRRYSLTASHIRGRVFRMGHKTTLGDWMWGMEVINTSTGQVIASDNCADYAKILDCCDEATAAARAAWFWSFTPKKVSR